MGYIQKHKFALLATIIQVIFLVLFAVFVNYADDANDNQKHHGATKQSAASADNSTGKPETGGKDVAQYYASKTF